MPRQQLLEGASRRRGATGQTCAERVDRGDSRAWDIRQVTTQAVIWSRRSPARRELLWTHGGLEAACRLPEGKVEVVAVA